jgi:hypothetical protein
VSVIRNLDQGKGKVKRFAELKSLVVLEEGLRVESMRFDERVCSRSSSLAVGYGGVGVHKVEKQERRGDKEWKGRISGLVSSLLWDVCLD